MLCMLFLKKKKCSFYLTDNSFYTLYNKISTSRLVGEVFLVSLLSFPPRPLPLSPSPPNKIERRFLLFALYQPDLEPNPDF